MNRKQPSSGFSHLSAEGSVRMVDVGEKPVVHRVAKAEGIVRCNAATIAALRERALPKGDVLATARIAAIQAAKRTAELIPLCHTLPLNLVEVNFAVEKESIRIFVEVSTDARTGVEMEALTATTIAALTIYDMCKAIDKQMVISEIRLTEKRKG